MGSEKGRQVNLDALRESLKAHEGVKTLPYIDTEGHQTVAVGHNLDQPMPAKLVDLILDFDIGLAVEELDRVFPSWRTHSESRQNVFVELCSNLGAPTLSKFVRFWAAMQSKDYVGASQELLASRWASQVHGRADTLARRLREDSLT